MRVFFSALASCVVFITVVGAQDDASKKDLDKLQGTWTIISLEVDGTKKEVKDGEQDVAIDGEKLSHNTPDGKKQGTIKLDAATNPKSIDFAPAGSDNRIAGIYALDGNNLRFCIAKKGDRPTKFEGGQDLVLITLKRAK